MNCPEIWKSIQVYKKLFQGNTKMPIEFELMSPKMCHSTSPKSLLMWNTKLVIVFFGMISSFYCFQLMVTKPDLIWIGVLQGYIGLIGIMVFLTELVIRFCGSELVYAWNCLLHTVQLVEAGNPSL